MTPRVAVVWSWTAPPPHCGMKSMYRRTSTTTLWNRTNQWKLEIYQDKATRFYYAYTQKTGMLISVLSFGGGMDSSEPITAKEEKRREWRLFLFIVVFLRSEEHTSELQSRG